MKILIIVLDGLGDLTYSELNALTPLEYAKTPNLDLFASKSMCGNLYALGPGIRPSSDVAHMELFGIDHNTYYTGRGPIELTGLKIPLENTDIAFRGNFAIVNSSNIIKDRRSGRRTPSIDSLQCLRKIVIENDTFELYHIAEHRFSLKVSGNNISPYISDSDPHMENVPYKRFVPTINNQNAVHTAEIMNRYVELANKILSEKNDVANCILLRSAGKKPKWDSFITKYGISAACITNNALYNGIGSLLGMEIVHPEHENNYEDYYIKIRHLIKKIKNKYDFIFLHLQEGDLYGEDGDLWGKVNAIEQMDATLAFINELTDDITVAITADHSTPCCLKAHSGDAVPLAIYGSNCRRDDVIQFAERACSKGILGTVLGKDFLSLVFNIAGMAQLIGG